MIKSPINLSMNYFTTNKKWALFSLWLLCILLTIACQPASRSTAKEGEGAIKINQLQVIGSHNSYKQAIEPALMQLLMSTDSARFLPLDYQHLPLDKQLDLGLRKLELDVVHDPQGGRFARPLGIELLKQKGIIAASYDEAGKMNEPGFKVLHVQDLDFRSHCLTLSDCLQEIKNWSDAHKNHLPIAISFNAKTDSIDRPGFVRPLPFTAAAFDSLDAAILSVVPREQIITPDVVRGNFASLEEAVNAHHWPELEQARGKFIFVLDEGGEKRETYIRGHPSLKGRIMFVNAQPGTPEAAFIILNDPVTYQDSIRTLVKNGYLVRTRADDGTKEARRNDYRRLEAALASGAQYISTDYYVPDQRFKGNYRVQLPEGVVARCNPVLPSKACHPSKLE
jgi:hypothetical protein